MTSLNSILPLLVAIALFQTSSHAFWVSPSGVRNHASISRVFLQSQNEGVSMEINTKENSINKKKIVIIGAGWAGWGAAKALCESGTDADIILMDAMSDPTGSTPLLSKSGKPIEPGHRGFWKDYPNIYNLCSELGLDENDIFTPYTNSSFYSPDGLEATAPVFSNSLFPMLPSPLGQVVATFPLFERIPLADRASMAGLLLATVDCLGTDDENVKEQYDRMTAHELFIRFGVSKRLVDDFIRPTLLVGLFKPPEELSALVVMELLYYYALAHQDSFDVRWIRQGTVSSSLIAPLALRLTERYGLKVMGGCRAGMISLDKSPDSKVLRATKVSYYDTTHQQEQTLADVDGIILALGSKGMENVVKASPALARLPVFSKAASCKSIDVISVRIWLDRTVETRTPANVFSRFASLRGAGGTFFMLDQLHDHEQNALWGVQDLTNQTNHGSVVACDFYNAGALMPLPDEDILTLLTQDLLPSAVEAFADARVVDSWIGKYPGSVSWFSPGSYDLRPPLEGAGSDVLPNVKVAGDWVKMGEREHGSKGLCQERAFVSGIQAANSLMASVAMSNLNHSVIPIRDDEFQFKIATAINKKVMGLLPRFWVR